MNQQRSESTVWLAFLESYKVVINHFERMYAEAGAPGLVEHEVMGRLGRAPDSKLRIQDLADLLLVSKSGASRIIDRMEEQRLVLRERSDTDRRVVYAVLTGQGKQALEKSREVWRAAYQECFSDVLDEHEIDEFNRLLQKMIVANRLEHEEELVAAFEG